MLSLIFTHYRVKSFIFNEKMNVNEKTAIHFNGFIYKKHSISVYCSVALDIHKIKTIENILFTSDWNE